MIRSTGSIRHDMVSSEHAASLYRSVLKSELAVIPGASHGPGPEHFGPSPTDAYADEVMPNALSARLAVVVDALPLTPCSRVLEVGCGPGAAARAVAARVTTGHVLAIDRSAKAVEQARLGFVGAHRVGPTERPARCDRGLRSRTR